MMDRILRAVVMVAVKRSARFFVRANQSFPGLKSSPLLSTPIDQEMLGIPSWSRFATATPPARKRMFWVEESGKRSRHVQNVSDSLDSLGDR